MPKTNETAINNWRQNISAEQTAVLEGTPTQRPDILIHSPRSMSVVIETEIEPADTVEKDARKRLGAIAKATVSKRP